LEVIRSTLIAFSRIKMVDITNIHGVYEQTKWRQLGKWYEAAWLLNIWLWIALILYAVHLVAVFVWF